MNSTKILDVKILAEHSEYLVVNKPAGLMVHGDGRNNEKTLCDFLIEKYPEINGIGEPLKIKIKDKLGKMTEVKIGRPGIIHRLDKETSGVMLVARTQAGFEYLKEQFKLQKVKKTYHAFIYGNIKEDEFTISTPIGRDKNDFRRWKAGAKARGQMRTAETFFKVLARSANKDITFIESRPKTGRTHQIRVHLTSIYKPIVSDKLYAPNREALLGFKRLALHAKKIEFTESSGQKVEYKSDYPEDFIKALATFDQIC